MKGPFGKTGVAVSSLSEKRVWGSLETSHAWSDQRHVLVQISSITKVFRIYIYCLGDVLV